MRHLRPLLGSGFYNVIVDKRFQLVSRFSWESSGKNQNVSEFARFSINGGRRLIIIGPDLGCSEHDEKGKQRAHRRQHTRGECSSADPQAGRKLHDYRVVNRGTEVSATKKHHRHPTDREVMEPIAQMFVPACIFRPEFNLVHRIVNKTNQTGRGP